MRIVILLVSISITLILVGLSFAFIPRTPLSMFAELNRMDWWMDLLRHLWTVRNERRRRLYFWEYIFFDRN